MASLLQIARAWGQGLGLLEIPEEERKMSEERLTICATSGPDGGHCPLAKESNFLKLISGKFKEVGAIYCTGCGCPVNEKSRVKEETCPEGKWTI